MQGGKTYAKLHLYKNQTVTQDNKENVNTLIDLEELSEKSPSKMTDEEKMLYRNKLFKEGDEISDYLSLQIVKCE